MSNYALHFSPGDNTEYEMYVWFQRDGIHYIEGTDEVGWTEPRRLGHTTRDMNDYEHMFWAIKPEYSEEVKRVSMFEVQPRKEGEHGRLVTGPQMLPEARKRTIVKPNERHHNHRANRGPPDRVPEGRAWNAG